MTAGDIKALGKVVIINLIASKHTHNSHLSDNAIWHMTRHRQDQVTRHTGLFHTSHQVGTRNLRTISQLQHSTICSRTNQVFFHRSIIL